MCPEVSPGTFAVPSNEYGIFALHTSDDQPMAVDSIQRIIDGPIAAAEPQLLEELAKPLDLFYWVQPNQLN